MTVRKSVPAPFAARRPHQFSAHGMTVTDDYAWLKDQKWQEVLRDPSVLDPDIRAYLEDENKYTESLLGHTSELQKKLVAEMRGRMRAVGMLEAENEIAARIVVAQRCADRRKR